jgi:flagellar biosynthesis/type III secretory pathway protein FliH
LFNPDPLKPAPRHWLDDTWLNSSSPALKPFGEFDWANVPKLDFSSVKFRQLATPEKAKVLDDDKGFVLETFGRKPTFKADGSVAAPTADQQPEQTPDLSEDALALHAADDLELQRQEQAQQQAERLRLHQLAEAEREQQRQLERVLFGSESMWRASDEEGLDAWPLGDDAPVIDPAALAAARDEAYARGHADGMSAGMQQGMEQGLAQGQAQGHEEGMRQAQAEAQEHLKQALEAQKAELSSSLQEQLQLLQQLNDKLAAFSSDPQALFEPLKRLALHISEQLVLAELTLSGQAIERLVQRCLDEIDLHGQSAITIELNPQDKARLEDIGGDTIKQLQLQSVPGLHAGSVRLLVNDSQIEDLIEHRLQAMANRLLNQPEQWREQSAFFRQPLAQRDGQVEDVPPRVVFNEAAPQAPMPESAMAEEVFPAEALTDDVSPEKVLPEEPLPGDDHA